jgi:hypothetical protein
MQAWHCPLDSSTSSASLSSLNNEMHINEADKIDRLVENKNSKSEANDMKA